MKSGFPNCEAKSKLGLLGTMKGVTEYFDYLDGLRGLAIVLLLEDHFIGFQPFGQFFDTGRVGLDIFFALSGFLIGGILFIQKQPLAKFYKRRISRILPAFLIFVTVIFSYAKFVGLPFTATEVVSTFLFLRTYIGLYPGIWDTPVPIGHIWSLNIEEHTYLFMSVFVLFGIFRKRIGAALILSGTACIAIGLFYAKLGTRAPHWGDLGTEVVAAHILISAGYRLIVDKFKFTVPRFAPLISLAAAAVFYTRMLPWWSNRLFLPFLMAFGINHLSQTYEEIKSLLSTKVLQRLGVWSYSIYLWQQPFQTSAGTFSAVSVRLALTMGIALFSFYVLEQPCRAWLNENW